MEKITEGPKCCGRVVSAWGVHSAHPGSNPSMRKLGTFVNFLVAQRSVTSWGEGTVDDIRVYLCSIPGGGG